jgi:hypothetical protein
MANFLNQGRATSTTYIVRRKRRKANTAQSSQLGFKRQGAPATTTSTTNLFQQNRILLPHNSAAGSQTKEQQILLQKSQAQYEDSENQQPTTATRQNKPYLDIQKQYLSSLRSSQRYNSQYMESNTINPPGNLSPKDSGTRGSVVSIEHYLVASDGGSDPPVAIYDCSAPIDFSYHVGGY